MKLVKIEHLRCGEYEGYTYLLAPDNITKEKFQEDVYKASKNYLKAKEDFKKMNERPKYLSPSLNEFPDNITIEEAKKRIEETNKELAKWRDAESKATRSFAPYMYELGYFSLYDADEDDGDCFYESINWGHRHGENIEYDITNTDSTYKEKKEKVISSYPILKINPELKLVDKIKLFILKNFYGIK